MWSSREPGWSLLVAYGKELETAATNDPYRRIGLEDLTADVNFTALALAGTEVGLDVLYYGPERALAGPFLADLLNGEVDSDLAEFLGSPQFKVLVQGRAVPALTLSPLETPRALFVDPVDLLSNGAERLAVLRRAMAADVGPVKE